MRETLHKWGMGKIKTERHWKRITVAQWRINLQEQPIYLKTCSSDIYSILNYVSFPPRTGSKPLLTVRKPIKSPFLSLTLLQIYCIGLIGLVTHFLWVWAAICDPTIPLEYLFCSTTNHTLLIDFLLIGTCYIHSNIAFKKKWHNFFHRYTHYQYVGNEHCP